MPQGMGGNGDKIEKKNREINHFLTNIYQRYRPIFTSFGFRVSHANFIVSSLPPYNSNLSNNEFVSKSTI